MKFLLQSTDDGITTAVIDTACGSSGRKWGIWHKVRVVQYPESVVYESSRTKGVTVLEEIEYDSKIRYRAEAAIARAMAAAKDVLSAVAA